MDKAPDAFRTISEVADDLDIPQHVLRFWETRFVQIKPMKRSGGRRFYRPDDVELLRGIRRLLYTDGYTIRGVQRILKEQGVKAVQAVHSGLAPSLEDDPPARISKRSPASRPEPSPPVDDSQLEAEADDHDEFASEGTSIVVSPPLPRPFTTPLPSLELRPNSVQTVGMVPRASLQHVTGAQVPPPARPPAIVPPPPKAAVAAAPPSYLPDLQFETNMPMPRRSPQPLEAQEALPEAPPPFDVRRLQPVLKELMAVRRLLDAAMQNGDPAP